MKALSGELPTIIATTKREKKRLAGKGLRKGGNLIKHGLGRDGEWNDIDSITEDELTNFMRNRILSRAVDSQTAASFPDASYYTTDTRIGS